VVGVKEEKVYQSKVQFREIDDVIANPCVKFEHKTGITSFLSETKPEPKKREKKKKDEAGAANISGDSVEEESRSKPRVRKGR
jgi:hypothetical protein